jgi:hypothetical protein
MVQIASTGYGQLRIRRLTYCGTLRRGRVIATRTLVDGGKMHSKHHTVKPQPVRPPTTLGPEFPHRMRPFAQGEQEPCSCGVWGRPWLFLRKGRCILIDSAGRHTPSVDGPEISKLSAHQLKAGA